MLRIFKKYYPIRNIFFVIIEGIFIFTSVLLASFIAFGHDTFSPDLGLLLKTFLITFVCQACLYYNDLYNLKIAENYNELSIRLLQALGFAAIILAFIYMLFPQAVVATGTFFISICLVILMLVCWRFLYSIILKHGFFNQKIAIVGSAQVTTDIKQEIFGRKDCGYRIALEIPEETCYFDFSNTGAPVIYCNKEAEGMCGLVNTLEIRKIIVALREKRDNFPLNELLKCRMEGIEVMEGNTFYEMLTGKIAVGSINPSWLIFSSGFNKTRLRLILKRALDLILSILLLVLCLPVIAITAILIKIDSKGPAIFSQDRVGKKGKIYRIHKFRSMVDDAEKESGPVWAQNDDERITRVGRFIRKWRIDELPQLWNVLKGDMSFVGPRPERKYFVNKLEEIIPYYSVRFTVKPGITGWAQVCYGYGASVEDAIEKLNYDLFYIKNMTTLIDLMIVLRTIKIVLFGTGAR